MSQQHTGQIHSKGTLPCELGHSLQEPGRVAVQRHGVALEASRCAALSPPLLPWTKTTCSSTELTSVGDNSTSHPAAGRNDVLVQLTVI